jgi:hypothetical protein
VSAPKPSPPASQYSFTGFQVNNPTAPPPGDRLDSEYARLSKAIADTIAWVDTSLNSDGSLKSPPSPAPQTSPPGVFAPAAGGHLIAGADPTALALDWAEVSWQWAEHMPDTIPPNILAVMGITGDHWSARWWANRAAQIVNAIGASPPPGTTIPVFDTMVLPNGAAGSVIIQSDGTHPITITLPGAPVMDQTLKFKDAAGNAGTHPITIIGAAGATIDGNPNYALVSDFMSLEVFWMGSQWGTR